MTDVPEDQDPEEYETVEGEPVEPDDDQLQAQAERYVDPDDPENPENAAEDDDLDGDDVPTEE